LGKDFVNLKSGFLNMADKSIEELEQECVNGNSKSCAILGACFERGDGVFQDFAKAESYYQRAAELGCHVSAHNLGRLCYFQDRFAEAAYWLNQAIEIELPRTFGLLGYLYQHGMGVEKNISHAFELYIRGSELGDSDAMLNLSWLLRDANEEVFDEAKADHYLTLACKQNHAVAWYDLGNQIEKRKIVTQLAQSWFECFERSAELGFEPMLERCGEAYAFGIDGVQENLDKAHRFLNQAIVNGSQRAKYLLSVLYAQGRGVPRDMKLAVELCQAAADANLPEAQFMLYLIFKDQDDLGSPSHQRAQEWLVKAADNGHPKAKTIIENEKAR
jgi:uncharacterized protein